MKIRLISALLLSYFFFSAPPVVASAAAPPGPPQSWFSIRRCDDSKPPGSVEHLFKAVPTRICVSEFTVAEFKFAPKDVRSASPKWRLTAQTFDRKVCSKIYSEFGSAPPGAKSKLWSIIPLAECTQGLYIQRTEAYDVPDASRFERDFNFTETILNSSLKILQNCRAQERIDRSHQFRENSKKRGLESGS